MQLAPTPPSRSTRRCSRAPAGASSRKSTTSCDRAASKEPSSHGAPPPAPFGRGARAGARAAPPSSRARARAPRRRRRVRELVGERARAGADVEDAHPRATPAKSAKTRASGREYRPMKRSYASLEPLNVELGISAGYAPPRPCPSARSRRSANRAGGAARRAPARAAPRRATSTRRRPGRRRRGAPARTRRSPRTRLDVEQLRPRRPSPEELSISSRVAVARRASASGRVARDGAAPDRPRASPCPRDPTCRLRPCRRRARRGASRRRPPARRAMKATTS